MNIGTSREKLKARMDKMLRRKSGATVEEMVTRFKVHETSIYRSLDQIEGLECYGPPVDLDTRKRGKLEARYRFKS